MGSIVHGTLAERLRRQIRNLLGFARVSSNLTGVVPPWLSWQSVRLLTDRSQVRSLVGALFNGGILGAFIGFSGTKYMGAPVAQMVERKTLNLVVVGSSPTGGGFFCFL